MLEGSDLTEALAKISAVPFVGVGYRAVHLEALFGFHRAVPYSTPLPLFAAGPVVTGARYTPVGGPATLYIALDPTTAYAEANRVHNLAWKTISPSAPTLPPTVLISVKIELSRVLDVTDRSTQTTLATSGPELLAPWRLAQLRGIRPPSQALGLAVFECERFQAILYPSTMSPGAYCIAIFPDRLTSSDVVETVDPDSNLTQSLT